MFNYVAPFLSQAKAVAWEYLKHYARPIIRSSNESELHVTLDNGGRVRLWGADNADAIRGTYSDGTYLDEYGDFKPSVWGNIIRPTLSDRQGWAVFGGTPKGKNQFWGVREDARKSADWFLLTLPASQSGLLPQTELDDAKRQLTEDQYAQEYECSFEAAILGAYYGRELSQLDRDGRIKEVEYDLDAKTFTAWDIGYRDDTAIWWYQVIRNEIHLIDFHASSGQSVKFYADLIKSKPYKYTKHWLPHDAKAKTLASGGKSIVEQLASLLGGLSQLAIVPNLEVQDGIQAVRMALPKCWFHVKHCEEGLEALRQYQREYDEDKKAFRERPRHDWTSHAADAFRMMAVAWRMETIEKAPAKGKTLPELTLDELYELHEQDQHLERRI